MFALRRLPFALAIGSMFSAVLFMVFGSFTASAAVANPDLAKGCGLDFVLVLDRSGSIATAGAQTTVKNAAKAFLNGLVDTGSRAALVSFAASGSIDQTALPLTSGTNLTTLDTKIDALGFTGDTNWEDGLEEAQGSFAGFGSNPDLVVMITDGQPTTDNGSGSAISRAAAEADTIKSGGTHMFALGVGNVGSFTGNLEAISESEQYPAPQADFTKADWSVVSNFADLGERVKDIAISLCGGTVTVDKRVNGVAAEGWEFTSPQADVASHTTAANGLATFDYSFSNTNARAISLQETGQPNYQFVSASCTMNNQTVLSTTSLPLQLNVGPNDKVNCTVNNRQLATLTITKDVVGAPDGTFPVNINCSDDLFDNPNAQISEALGITMIDIPVGVTCKATEAANGNFDTTYSPSGGQVTIADGPNAIRIKNTRRTGGIIIRQQNAPGMTDEFDFTAGSLLTPLSFLLPGGGNQAFPGVATGTYSVTQNPLVVPLAAVQPGTYLASIVCDDANSTVDLPNGTATVNVDDDETVTCTFVNALRITEDPDPGSGCERDSQAMRVASSRGPGHGDGCDDDVDPQIPTGDDPFDTAGDPNPMGGTNNPAPEVQGQTEVKPEAPAVSPVAVAPAVINAPIPTRELPRTGSNLVSHALLGLVLLIMGAATMILGRRRAAQA